MNRNPKPVRPELAAKLAQATTRKNDADETYRHHIDLWKDLIVEAVDDEGASATEVAKLAGVSLPRVTRIIADHYAKSA